MRGPEQETLIAVRAVVNEENDNEIIRRVLSGDIDEFRHLVLRHQDQVFAMVMRQTGDVSIAKELTQDAFVNAFNNLSSFRFEAKFSTWIIRIALNLTSSYFTSKRFKQRKREEEFQPERHEMSTDEFESKKMKEAMILALREALHELKPIFRDVLVLCGLEGKSYEEAAAILDIPIGTVRSRLNKARLILKQQFGVAA